MDESKNAVRDESDNASSVESYQDGVKAIEAISKAWDMKSLIVAYCRYAARWTRLAEGEKSELTPCQSHAHGHHYFVGRPSDLARRGLRHQ